MIGSQRGAGSATLSFLRGDLNKIHTFVLSGGVGARLWPLSRVDRPKQLHDLTGGGTLLQNTISRMQKGGDVAINVIASQRHAGLVSNIAASAGDQAGRNYYEPLGRNTLAPVALAAQSVIRESGDGLVLIAPSDAHIRDPDAFWSSVEAGVAAAQEGSIVVFGIVPGRAETGYGYIEVESKASPNIPLDAKKFVEKPDAETAQSYFEAGTFLWNSGIFFFRASAMKDHFERLQPDTWKRMAAILDAAEPEGREDRDVMLPEDKYQALSSLSVDKGLIEKVSPITVVPAAFDWNDLGSWMALHEVGSSDDEGNVVSGPVEAIDCKNSLLRSTGPLLGVYGIEDHAIVATPDAVFAAPLDQAQEVRQIVERLEKRGSPAIRQSATTITQPGTNRQRARSWLVDQALPLWSTKGIDQDGGGFHEVLDLEYNPVRQPKRLRTMARQTYVFAKAKEQDWLVGAEKLVQHGLEFLDKNARTERGSFAKTFTFEGETLDETADLYDYAFVLLACSASVSCGIEHARALGNEVVQQLASAFRLQVDGGFRETLSGDTAEARLANPHMHLFEACMAWYRATKDTRAEQWAHELASLFCERFFDSETWTVRECLPVGDSPLDPGLVDLREPGHGFEWAWLLQEYAETFERKSASEVLRLVSAATTSGINGVNGLTCLQVSSVGGIIDGSSRSWAQCEAAKASLALARSGRIDHAHIAEHWIEKLFDQHIDPAPTGMWLDRIDALGSPPQQAVPASILYHLVSLLDVYLQDS